MISLKNLCYLEKNIYETILKNWAYLKPKNGAKKIT